MWKIPETAVLPRPTEPLAGRSSERRNMRYKRKLRSGHGRRLCHRQLTPRFNIKIIFAANPEKLISVFTVMDSEIPTVT